jgi:predicted small lipoprotein YifL
MKRVASLLVAVGVVLAGCGKLGPPQPPGPPDKVTWPHAYPTYHPPP